MRVAAVDQGTTSTRVLIADTNGHLEIAHAVTHQQFHPHPGWVEHDPEELLANIRRCLEVAGAVDAIGIDNQGESCVAWDAETGAALSPVIVWQDNRTAEAIARLKDRGAASLTLSRAGLPLDAYFSASKLAWIVDNIPAAKDALNAGRLRLGTTDAFFLDRLTGHFTTDVTTASRTSLMNLETGQWDPDLCELFGVPFSSLPEIRSTVADYGRVNGVPITASIVDQQAALFGHGCRDPGDAKITFGTGAFALAVTGKEIARAPEKGLLPTVAWAIDGELTYAVDGGVYDAGAALEWAKRIGLISDIEKDLEGFSDEPAISRGIVFVPAFSGLACPHWDRTAASLFIGMSQGTTQADLRQALLEGIALSAADVVTAMEAHVPIGGSIAIDGGLARNRYFAQFLADMIGRDVIVSEFDERTAFGTARLAALGAGATLPDPSSPFKAFQPRLSNSSLIRKRFHNAISRSKGWRDLNE
jgi:glycerol kinase